MGASGRHEKNESDLSGIQEVKARHERHLLALPGVVSVGIGKSPDGTMAIIVGMDRHRPETLPEIPEDLEGYRVRVEIVGRIRPL